MMRLPPLPTLFLAGTVAIVGACALLFLGPPDASAIRPSASGSSQETGATQMSHTWPGPRAATKREILIAPLFAEDRKLPAPFETAPPQRTNATTQSPKTTVPDVVAAEPPKPRAPDSSVAASLEPPAHEEPPVSAPPPIPLDLPSLRLVGTFIAEERGIARALLIEEGSESEEVWVDEYGNYADWVLTIVSPEAVRLEAGEETLILEMWDDNEDTIPE